MTWKSFGMFGVPSSEDHQYRCAIYCTPYGELCFCSTCRLRRKVFGPTTEEAEGIKLYEA